MITGTTIGEISEREEQSPDPGSALRHIPSAASVPSSVASNVADAADDQAVPHRRQPEVDVKKSWYQRRLKPGSG